MNSLWFTIFVLYNLLMLYTIHLDKTTNYPEFKWWALLILSPTIIFLFGGRFDYSILNYGMIYIGIGLLYSIYGFFIEIMKSRTFFQNKWEEFLYKPVYHRIDGKSVTSMVQDLPEIEYNKQVRLFARDEDYKFIKLETRINDDMELINPRIDKVELVSHLIVWTIFWVWYLTHMLIGDFVMNILRYITNRINDIASKFLNNAFKGVFKHYE